MFTIDQINSAHDKIKSGADFPKYVAELIQLGVSTFEIWVDDSRSIYKGADGYAVQGLPQYEKKTISPIVDKNQFLSYLKIHQQGQTDYFMFCQHCAETGIVKWIVDLAQKTCTYYDNTNQEIYTEAIKA